MLFCSNKAFQDTIPHVFICCLHSGILIVILQALMVRRSQLSLGLPSTKHWNLHFTDSSFNCSGNTFLGGPGDRQQPLTPLSEVEIQTRMVAVEICCYLIKSFSPVWEESVIAELSSIRSGHITKKRKIRTTNHTKTQTQGIIYNILFYFSCQ